LRECILYSKLYEAIPDVFSKHPRGVALDQVRRLVAAEPGEPDVDADAFLAELVAGIMLESGEPFQ